MSQGSYLQVQHSLPNWLYEQNPLALLCWIWAALFAVLAVIAYFQDRASKKSDGAP